MENRGRRKSRKSTFGQARPKNSPFARKIQSESSKLAPLRHRSQSRKRNKSGGISVHLRTETNPKSLIEMSGPISTMREESYTQHNTAEKTFPRIETMRPKSPVRNVPESKSLSTPSLKTYFVEQISPDNLKELLEVTGNLPTKEELEEWIIEFRKEGLFTEKELIKAFKLYDEDGGGTITRDEIKKIIDLIGEDITESEIEELIREADIDGDGEIDYVEFVKLILSEKI